VFPGTNARERLYTLKASPFSNIETGRDFHGNGITVSKTIQAAVLFRTLFRYLA